MHQVPAKAVYVVILGSEGFARGLLFAALLSYWVVQARLGPLQLLLLGTAIEATLFCLQIPTGAFADAMGRRPATAIGYALLGVGLGLQALTRDFGALLLLQALSGAAWAFLIGSIEAWIAEAAGADRLQRLFLRGGQAQVTGLAAGLAVTIALGLVDPRLPILAGGALLLAVSAAAALLMREERPTADFAIGDRLRGLVATARLGLADVRASRSLLILVLVALALGASSEGWDRLYTAHLLRDLGLASVRPLTPVAWLALVGLVECALAAVAMQLSAIWVRGSRPKEILATLYLAQGVLMLAFALLASLPAALIAFLAAETIRRLGQPLVDAWVAGEATARTRATALSVVGQADSLGQIAAGPLVGLLANVSSIPAALGVSAALLLPAALLVVRAGRRAGSQIFRS
jgi:DHA3 family tetracycline resistance protein-like MFS transporter